MVPNPAAYAQLVIEAIYDWGIKERCNVQSFDFEILKQVRAQDASIRLDVLIGGREPIESVIEKLGFKPYSWNPYFTNLNDSIVAHAHSMQMSVIPWTVNEMKDMKKLVDMGVDGIITDYPNRFQEMKASK
jgi:glycerophosphoryl diester phosphodiesterase